MGTKHLIQCFLPPQVVQTTRPSRPQRTQLLSFSPFPEQVEQCEDRVTHRPPKRRRWEMRPSPPHLVQRSSITRLPRHVEHFCSPVPLQERHCLVSPQALQTISICSAASRGNASSAATKKARSNAEHGEARIRFMRMFIASPYRFDDYKNTVVLDNLTVRYDATNFVPSKSKRNRTSFKPA